MEVTSSANWPAESSWACKVILLCARTRLDSFQSATLVELCASDSSSGKEWEELVDLASRHCILPLVFWSLKSIDWQGVPALTRTELEHVFHAIVSRSFSLTHELVRVSALLHEHGIQIVSFKGPTLASAIYGSVALRQFSDLDLLVSRNDVLKARHVLIEDAYQMRVPMQEAQEEAHIRDDSVFDLMREAPQVMVELHWGVTSRCFARPITFELVQAHLHDASLVGTKVPHLATEELLLILCVHGTKHLWERLQWIADVNELLQRHAETLDWERVYTLAQNLRLERMLFLGLLIAHEVQEAPLPTEVITKVKGDAQVSMLAAQVRGRLFESTPVSPIESSLFLLRCMDSWRDQARFVAHLAFTPPADDRAQLPLPGPLERLRPLVRVVSLISVYAGRALRLSRL